jgi:hypothetical protein
MPVTEQKPQAAFDEFASQVLKFSPHGLWRTFVAVRNAGEGDESLALAIATQDRTVILSPFQYLTGTLGLVVLLFWAIAGLVEGEFGKMESLSFLDPDMLPLLIWPFVFAIPLHFMLGAGRREGSMVDGIWDGIWKIYQLLMYMLGQFFIFFIFLSVGLVIGDIFPSNLVIVVGILFGLGGGLIIIYPLITKTMPQTLGKLYGVSSAWAGFSAFALCMTMFATHSLVTTGHLPE